MSNLIITPEHEDFYSILHSKPPPGSDWINSQKIFVSDAESGLLKQVDYEGLEEYIYGGEYDLMEENSDFDEP